MNDNYSRFKGWTESSFGHYKRHWAAYYRKELHATFRAAELPFDRPLHLLEIGFGNGAFMSWARDEGHSVVGLEIETSRLEAARQAGFIVAGSLEELLPLCEKSEFDGVVAFDVFEHVTSADLERLLIRLRDILKPGGWLMARFPNGDSPFGLRNQNGDLTHVTSLGSMAMHQLATSTGLRLLSVRAQSLPILRVGLSRSAAHLVSIAVRFVLELPIQLLMNAYYSGEFRWFALTPNLVVRFGTARVKETVPR